MCGLQGKIYSVIAFKLRACGNSNAAGPSVEQYAYPSESGVCRHARGDFSKGGGGQQGEVAGSHDSSLQKY